MNTLKSSTQLKANARNTLAGKYTQVVVVQILFFMISAFLTTFLSFKTTGTITSLIISFFVQLICASNLEVFRYGLIRMYMNLCCGYRFGARDLYFGFLVNNRRTIAMGFLLTIIQTFYLLPLNILLSYYHTTGNSQWAYAAIACFILGFMISYLISLSLSQSLYLLLDFPNKSVKDILKLSCWMMKGNKMRLFLLQLSFLPIFLLAVLSCGIGLLWVEPYMATTYTGFYLNLASTKAGD